MSKAEKDDNSPEEQTRLEDAFAAQQRDLDRAHRLAQEMSERAGQ